MLGAQRFLLDLFLFSRNSAIACAYIADGETSNATQSKNRKLFAQRNRF